MKLHNWNEVILFTYTCTKKKKSGLIKLNMIDNSSLSAFAM